MATHASFGKIVVSLVKGDITSLDVDAIVNAANSQLLLGAGVAGAIRRAGGPSIQDECDAIGGTAVGTAVITGGGNLKAKHVIHAVGPRHGEPDADQKLASSTRSSLMVAESAGLSSIAFPAISTGIFQFPIDKCATIMIGTTVDFLKDARSSNAGLSGWRETCLKEIVFCLFSTNDFQVFSSALGRHRPQGN